MRSLDSAQRQTTFSPIPKRYDWLSRKIIIVSLEAEHEETYGSRVLTFDCVQCRCGAEHGAGVEASSCTRDAEARKNVTGTWSLSNQTMGFQRNNVAIKAGGSAADRDLN